VVFCKGVDGRSLIQLLYNVYLKSKKPAKQASNI
jgi:hypothetical protein